MIQIGKWKLSQSRGCPAIKYGKGSEWGRAVELRADPHVKVSLELELNYDSRNRGDSKRVRDLIDALVAVRDRCCRT